MPIEEQIEEIILDDYKYLRNIVADVATSDPLLQSILSGIANGDRRTNSSFRRAGVSFKNGMECVEELFDMEVLDIEKSLSHLTNQRRKKDVSEKLIIRAPFLRFWFGFISPIFKGIRDGEYGEFFEDFKNREAQFRNFIFEQLSLEFLKENFKDNKITQIGRYWDDENSIDLVAKTNSGKILACSCKYTNQKVKKTELNRLKENCKKAELFVDTFILFSKNGFTSELKTLKGDELKLFTAKSLKALI